MARSRMAVGLGLCVLVARAATAQTEEPRLGHLGSSAPLVVTGASAFPPEGIVQAVRRSSRFLIESHPRAPLQRYLQWLEETVRSGYLAAGFAEPQVTAAVDKGGSVVTLKVVEGPRLRAGDVAVQGNKAVAAAAIVQALTEPRQGSDGETRKAVWPAGSPARFDAGFPLAAEGAVRSVYARAGYLAPSVQVVVDPEAEDKARLLVHVAEEGMQHALGEVRFSGSFTDPEPAIREAAGIRPDSPLDTASLDALRSRLQALGRYSKVVVEKPEPREGGKADFTVKLWQAPFAPPLGAPETEVRKAVRRAAQWLSEPAKWQKTLAVRAKSGPLSSGSASGMSTSMEFQLAHDGILFALNVTSTDGSPPAATAFSLLRGEAQLVIAWGPLKLWARSTARPSTQLLVRAAVEPLDPEAPKDGDRSMRLILGLAAKGDPEGATRAPFSVQVELPEVSQTYFATWERLHFQLEDKSLQVGYRGEDKSGPPAPIGSIDRATGACRFTRTERLGEGEVTFGFEDSSLAARVEALRRTAENEKYGEAAFVPFLGGALAIAAVGALSSALKTSPAPAAGALDPRLEAALVIWFGALQAMAKAGPAAPAAQEEAPGTGKFWLPYTAQEGVSATDSAVAWMAGRLSALVAPHLPPGSWPDTLLREACCVASRQAPYVGQEIDTLLKAPDLGPIGCWVASEAMRAGGMAKPSSLLAQKGLRVCTLEGLEHEKGWLSRPGYLPRRVIEAVGDAVRGLREVDAAQVIEAGERTEDLTARGFVPFFKAARARPTAVEAGLTLLEGYWVAGLRDFVRGRLRALSGGEG